MGCSSDMLMLIFSLMIDSLMPHFAIIVAERWYGTSKN